MLIPLKNRRGTSARIYLEEICKITYSCPFSISMSDNDNLCSAKDTLMLIVLRNETCRTQERYFCRTQCGFSSISKCLPTGLGACFPPLLLNLDLCCFKHVTHTMLHCFIYLMTSFDQALRQLENMVLNTAGVRVEKIGHHAGRHWYKQRYGEKNNK